MAILNSYVSSPEGIQDQSWKPGGTRFRDSLGHGDAMATVGAAYGAAMLRSGFRMAGGWHHGNVTLWAMKNSGFFCKRHGILLGELPWFGILLGQICPKRFVAATRDPHAPAVIAMVGDESHELQCLHLDHYPGNCPVNIMKGACYSCLATSSRTARGQTSGFLLGWGDTDHMKSLAGRVWPTKNHWGAAAEVHKVYLVYFLGTHSSKVHKQVPTGPACQMAFPLAATAVASNCPRRPWWWGTAAQGPGWANVDGHCWAACRVCWGLAVPSGKLT